MVYRYYIAAGVQTTKGVGYANVEVSYCKKFSDWTYRDYQEISEAIARKSDMITGVTILHVMPIKEG